MSGGIDAGELQVKYCSENNKRLIHFSTCEVYGKTIGSFLPKDHPLRQVNFASPSVIISVVDDGLNMWVLIFTRPISDCWIVGFFVSV